MIIRNVIILQGSPKLATAEIGNYLTKMSPNIQKLTLNICKFRFKKPLYSIQLTFSLREK